MRTHPVEPEAGPWQAVPLPELLADLRARCVGQARAVVAIDGRSAGGKSTLAARLAAALGAEVVHTDDVAWWHDFFDWDVLLIDGVLEPYLAGDAVGFRPPAWEARGREGAITISPDCSIVLLEGVGSSRRSLAPYLSAAVWVQSDWPVAEARGIARDMRTERADPTEAQRFWDDWEAGERALFAADRPWERADVVVCGTPLIEVGQDEVLIGATPAPST
ncbi:MAG: hypothetical protein WCF36_11160 [Candidatus Nanopelagicales bacterium]